MSEAILISALSAAAQYARALETNHSNVHLQITITVWPGGLLFRVTCDHNRQIMREVSWPLIVNAQFEILRETIDSLMIQL